jgi:hypothetical protein
MRYDMTPQALQVCMQMKNAPLRLVAAAGHFIRRLKQERLHPWVIINT